MEEPSHQPRPEDFVVLLGQLPERAHDIVAGLEHDALAHRHAPALPTLAELAVHLALTGTAADATLRRVVLEHADEVDLAGVLDALPAPARDDPVEAVERYMRDRRRTVDLLHGLAPADWARPLIEGRRGELTLLALCELVGAHESGHLGQLRNLVALLPAGTQGR